MQNEKLIPYMHIRS